MKINIKKIGLLLLIALFFSFIIFKHYEGKTQTYYEFYIIQVGAYENYDNVIKKTKEFDNYIIYQENNLYKIFIGVTCNDKIYEELINTYSKNKTTYKKIIKTTDEELIKAIKNYDSIIKNTKNKNDLNIIIKEELKLLNKLLSKKTKEWYHVNRLNILIKKWNSKINYKKKNQEKN